MNIHNKLKEMGFKKTKFYKLAYKYDGSVMEVDEFEDKYVITNGVRKTITSKKIHPKSNSFWIMKYNDIYTLYVLVKNCELNTIYLEDNNFKPNSDGPVSKIYDYNRMGVFKLNSKLDIINLLPTEIKRDFTLNRIFN